jgi:hypothetical protein
LKQRFRLPKNKKKRRSQLRVGTTELSGAPSRCQGSPLHAPDRGIVDPRPTVILRKCVRLGNQLRYDPSCWKLTTGLSVLHKFCLANSISAALLGETQFILIQRATRNPFLEQAFKFDADDSAIVTSLCDGARHTIELRQRVCFFFVFFPDSDPKRRAVHSKVTSSASTRPSGGVENPHF